MEISRATEKILDAEITRINELFSDKSMEDHRREIDSQFDYYEKPKKVFMASTPSLKKDPIKKIFERKKSKVKEKQLSFF